MNAVDYAANLFFNTVEPADFSPWEFRLYQAFKRTIQRSM